VVEALAADGSGTGDLRPLVDALTELSGMIRDYGDLHALDGDPAWPDLHGVDPLDAVELNVREARIDPETNRFHVVDQAIMAAQISSLLGPDFAAHVADQLARAVPLDARAAAALLSPDQYRQVQRSIEDPAVLGLHVGALRTVFLRPGRTLTELAASIVHESVHALQPDWQAERRALAQASASHDDAVRAIGRRLFEREFAGFSVQREFLMRLAEQWGPQSTALTIPATLAWMLDSEVSDAIQQHIYGQYFRLGGDGGALVGGIGQSGGPDSAQQVPASALEGIVSMMLDGSWRQLVHFGFDEPEKWRDEPSTVAATSVEGAPRGQ